MFLLQRFKEFVDVVIADFHDNWELWWYYNMTSDLEHMYKVFWYAINIGWYKINNVHPIDNCDEDDYQSN